MLKSKMATAYRVGSIELSAQNPFNTQIKACLIADLVKMRTSIMSPLFLR